MQYHPKKLNPKPALAVLLGLSALLPTLAQSPFEYFERRDKTEVYGIGQYLHSEDVTFNGPTGDVKLKMDDTGLGGFGVAFHFNDFISIHGDFMFGSATWNGDVPLGAGANPIPIGGTTHIKQDTFIQSGRFNVDYNIINRRITPFITAGIGYQYIEAELSNLPPIGGWYWDPWFGWVYYSDHPHAWQTDFTWNAGAGIRWNILDNLFIRVTASANWLEYSGSHGVTTQIEGIFAIGATF